LAIIDDTQPEKKGPSLVLQLAALGGVTVVAIGIGWLAGVFLNGTIPHPETAEAHGEAPTAVSLGEISVAQNVVYLDPIMTNMSGPVEMWARLEAAIVFDGPPDALVAQEVQQDMMSYLRSVRSHQVEGASGLQHLRSDLEERARLRSDGRVTQVLIRALLFE
jgi:flagellar protein FliL